MRINKRSLTGHDISTYNWRNLDAKVLGDTLELILQLVANVHIIHLQLVKKRQRLARALNTLSVLLLLIWARY